MKNRLLFLALSLWTLDPGSPVRGVGDADPRLADSIEKTGSLLDARKNDEARELARKTLDRTRAAAGEDHPSTALALRNVARVDLAMGRYAEAEKQLLTCLQILEKQLSEHHPELLDTWILLAEACVEQGAQERALEHYQRAWALMERLGRENDPAAAKVAVATADCMGRLNRPGDMEAHLLRALSILENSFGPEHPESIRLRERLDAHARAQGRSALPRYVGSHGSPDRLDLVGARQVPVAEIRAALHRSKDILLASHPTAPFPAYLQELTDGLRGGYQHAGYGEVRVGTRYDDKTGSIRVEIEEGPKYSAGGIRVTGLKTLSESNLVQCLTVASVAVSVPPLESQYFNYHSWRAGNADNPKAPVAGLLDLEKLEGKKPTEPVWIPGKPVCLNEACGTSIYVTEAMKYLASQGRSFAKVEAHLEADPSAKRVNLHIDVIQEGVQTRIGAIEFAGLKRHTRQEMLDYLGLASGQMFSESVMSDVTRILEQSGRFADQKVTGKPAAEDKLAVDLTIEVMEVPGVPKLSETLTPGQQDLMSLGARLSNLLAWEEELVFSLSREGKEEAERLQVVFAPAKGIHLHIPGQIAIAVRPQEGLLIHDIRNGKILESRVEGELQIVSDITIARSKDPSAEHPNTANLSFGLSTGRESPDDPFVKLNVNLAPACLLGLEAKYPDRWVSTNGVRRLEGGGLILEWDQTSGRLVRASYAEDKPEGRLDVVMAKGRFDAAMTAMRNRVTANTVHIGESASVAVKAAFMTDLICEGATKLLMAEEGIKKDLNAENIGTLALLARKLVERGVLNAFADSPSTETTTPASEEKFSIPSEQSLTKGAVDWMGMALAAGVYEQVDKLFAPETWPNRVFREILFNLNGNRKYTRVLLEDFRKHPDGMGPVGCLAVSLWLQAMGFAEAPEFAARGLGDLDKDGFRKDWMLLFGRETALSRSLEDLKKILGGFSDADIQTIAQALPEELRLGVFPLLLDLRAHPDRSAAEFFAPLFDLVWEHALKELVEKQLVQRAAGAALDPAKVAATVNGVVIPRKKVDAFREARRAEMRGPLSLPEAEKKLEEDCAAFLDRLIDQEIVFQHFMQTAGSAAEGLLRSALTEVIEKQFHGNQGAYLLRLNQQGLEQGDVGRVLALDLVRAQIQESLPSASEEQLRAFYDRNTSGLFAVPALYHVHLIQISAANHLDGVAREAQKKKLEDIRQRVVKGANFDELARAVSEHRSATNNGHWAWFKEAELNDAYKEMFQKMEPKGVGPVLEEKDNLLLCYLVGKKEGGVQPFAEALPLVRQHVRAAQKEQVWNDWLAAKRAAAVVVRPGEPVPRPVSAPDPKADSQPAAASPAVDLSAKPSPAPLSPDELYPMADRPNPIRRLTGFVDGADISVPMEKGHSWPYVKVSIQGRDAGWFLVATGWGRSCISAKKARELGLFPAGVPPAPAQSGAGATPARQVWIHNMKIGGITVDSPTLFAGPLDSLGTNAVGGEISGVLGGDILGQVPVTLDFQSNRLTFHNPERFHPPTSAREVAFSLRRNCPVVPARINGRELSLMLLTDGAGLKLLPNAVKKFPELSRGPLVRKEAFGDQLEGKHIVVFVETRKVELEALGDVWPAQEATLGIRGPPDTPEKDGFLGGHFFQQFSVTLDYGRRKAWFVRRPPVAASERMGVAEAVNRADLQGLTPLHDAIMLGDTDGVEGLLKAGADPKIAHPNGMKSLALAAQYGDERMVKLLLATGADAQERAQGAGSVSPLMCAIRNFDAGVAKALLDAGMDPNNPSYKDEPPLLAAASYGNAEVFRLIEEAGGNPKAKSEAGNNLLASAWIGGSPALISHAMDLGFTDVPPGASPLAIAAMLGHRDAVSWLLKRGEPVNPAPPGMAPPLPLALASGRDDLVSLLLDAGADPNRTVRGVNCLMLAAKGVSPENIRLLLAKGLEVNATDAQGKSALNYAAEELRPAEVLEVLLRAGARVNHSSFGGEPAIWAYLRQGRAAEVRILLWAGADPERLGKEGLSPICVAAFRRSPRMVEDLIAAGAQIDPVNPNHNPLVAALQVDDPEIVRILLKNGANANRRFPLQLQVTPLIIAAAFGNSGGIVELLRAQADVSSVDAQGCSSLHLAAGGAPREAVRALIDAGGRLEARTRGGLTPLQLAVQHHNAEAVEVLLAAGADSGVLLPGTRKTLLALAEKTGDARIASLLLNQPGAAPNPPSVNQP